MIEEMKKDFLMLSNIEMEIKYNKKYESIRKICNKLGIKKGPKKNNDKFTNERTLKIYEKCKSKKYKFLKFENGKYENSYTKFYLECTKDGYIWETNYNKLVNQDSECHKCHNQHKKDIGEKNNIIDKINSKCEKNNYILLNISDSELNTKTKITVKCNRDNYHWQTTLRHFIERNQNCPKCIGRYKTIEEVKNEIELKCKDRNYTFLGFKEVYINNKSKFRLKCSFNHTWETYYSNFISNDRCCPRCIESKGETTISKILDDKSIEYIKEMTFDECKYKRKLRFDFYLPKFNICIEYDGIQHFEAVDRFGGNQSLNENIKKDHIKNEFCLNNDIEIIRIKYDQSTEDIINALSHIHD